MHDNSSLPGSGRDGTLRTTGSSGGFLGAIAATWAVAGWSATLGIAIARLSTYAAEALASELTGVQLATLCANTAMLAWAEGYRGFQRKFSPRAAARVLYLRNRATLLTALLAPLFCVGFFGATARIVRLTWFGTGLIVLLVVVVHQLPQPWRGIVDAGVVVGLGWGLVSFLGMCARALATGAYPVSPEVPQAA
jgi:hypothetical protein